jgi:hypothetical protein
MGGLHNKQTTYMHYCTPLHRSKLFDPLQQTIEEKEKFMKQLSPFDNGVALHHN